MPSMTAINVLEGILRTSGGAILGSAPPLSELKLRCPSCGKDGPALSFESLAANHDRVVCKTCSFATTQKSGIWLALPPDRQRHFAQFMRDYERVRKLEGRGSASPNFYLSLPFHDLTGRNASQWSIRARTFKHIAQDLLATLSGQRGSPLKVLDLGAGNAWMSYRLASLGHQPVAVDLLTNTLDGLGAAIHYQSVLPKLFPRFQADLDHLPFADDQFDCAIFNASFHYSENYKSTLSEAIRCLAPGGAIIIADTPTYSQESAGQKMIDERRQLFQKSFGCKSDSLQSGEYLTPARLLALEGNIQLEWRTHRVWYGYRWAARPLIARLKGRREPSQFRIYSAQVKQ
jgi:ubiquinone/menaquinone biosynthesis C-methylase UbiE